MDWMLVLMRVDRKYAHETKKWRSPHDKMINDRREFFWMHKRIHTFSLVYDLCCPVFDMHCCLIIGICLQSHIFFSVIMSVSFFADFSLLFACRHTSRFVIILLKYSVFGVNFLSFYLIVMNKNRLWISITIKKYLKNFMFCNLFSFIMELKYLQSNN